MNATGHMILFQMAYNNMTPQVQKRVTELVHNPNNPEEGGYQTPAAASDVPSAATYPDIYKADARLHPWRDDKGYNHYLNQPIGDARFTAGKTAPALNGLNCLTSQEAFLQDPKASDDLKANALRWTVHLYGDIGAQPAHVVNGYSKQFPDGDEGGNEFKLSWGSQSRRDASLHTLLDVGGAHVGPDGLAENNFKPLPRVLDSASRTWIEGRAAMLAQQFPRERYEVRVQDQNPSHWASDLKTQAEQMWSQFKPGESMAPSDARLAGIEQTMNENVAVAAYRLADLCNRVFATSAAVAESAAGVPPHAPYEGAAPRAPLP